MDDLKGGNTQGKGRRVLFWTRYYIGLIEAAG